MFGLLSALITGAVFAFHAYAVLLLVSVILHDGGVLILLFVPVILTILPFALLWLILCATRVGHLAASYVMVSPAGLEIRSWPAYRIFVQWENIERVGRPFGGHVMVRLNRTTEVGEGAAAVWVRRIIPQFGIQKPGLYWFSGIQGYPRGSFADQLRQYAPHLITADSH